MDVTCGAHPLAATSFAVIDFETTGLRPEGPDRVVSVAVVAVDNGEITSTWSTLVNPGRPVGESLPVHGLTDEMLAGAPTFREIAPELVDRLAGRVIVAHNLDFDFKTVKLELKRNGTPIHNPERMCTLRAARKLIADSGPGTWKLTSLAERFGIELGASAHSALPDAIATAHLIGHLLDLAQRTGNPDAVTVVGSGRLQSLVAA